MTTPTPDPDRLVASGGFCAPSAPLYSNFLDLGPTPEELVRSRDALAAWFGGIGQECLAMAAQLNTTPEARLLLADNAARIVLATYKESPVERSLPKLSAPRGGIHFLPPPDITSPEWQRAQARRKRRERLSRLAEPFRRAKAARRRLSDARAVWRGTKEALSEAEIDNLRDY